MSAKFPNLHVVDHPLVQHAPVRTDVFYHACDCLVDILNVKRIAFGQHCCRNAAGCRNLLIRLLIIQNRPPQPRFCLYEF